MSEILSGARRVAGIEIVEQRSARRVLAVALFALLTALGAYAEVPLPGNLVPVTLQTLFVLLSGVLLGPVLSASAQLAYLAAGAAGLPVFAGGAFGLPYMFGPTGGYLMAFPLAAAAAGLLAGPARRDWVGAARLLSGLVLGSIVVFAGGVAWLSLYLGDPGRAVALGLIPFLAGGVLKVLAGFVAAYRYRDRTLELL